MKLIDELKEVGEPDRAKLLQGFFKTGPGQYGEGDAFLGIPVPVTRKIAKKYRDLPFEKIETLLENKFHEVRLAALLLLVHRYETGTNQEKQQVVDFYLNNTKRVNNWDLVDLSAHKILGAHLLHKDKSILYHLAKSKNLWERRISIIATAWFINKNQFEDTIKISEILLHDKHDLIHKAVGWMLRELGKKDQSLLEEFLNKHTKNMPRTMLRYAIEKFEETKRQYYLKK